MQRVIRHTMGTFHPCDRCHTEPRHIAHTGRTGREARKPGALLLQQPMDRHALECPCGRSTGMCESLDVATSDWGRRFTQMPLALSSPATGRVVRMPRKRKVVANG